MYKFLTWNIFHSAFRYKKLTVIALMAGLLFGCEGQFGENKMSYQEAVNKLQAFKRKVNWNNDIISQVELIKAKESTLADTLPPIKKFPLVVGPKQKSNSVLVEIFVSSEKSGTGSDGWMNEVARDFNSANIKLASGKLAKIQIRKIASGTGYQFISSKKYQPHAYSPSNHYWIHMAEAKGIKMTPILEKTVGNLAGLVMKQSTAKQLSSGGDVTIGQAVDAVVQGKVVAGYTNPYASSTGLNFLVSILANFSQTPDDMLSPEVVSAFEGFQKHVPFVAMTTLQMRDSVINDGSLDMFVMEYQTYKNSDALKSGYRFIPFGQPHNNPLYAVGSLSKQEQQVLDLFQGYLTDNKHQKKADKYGFNPSIKHSPLFDMPNGSVLVDAQRIWKEKKDIGRPIAAVFLADVSGSMMGARMQNLKTALFDGSNFISPENAIGLVTFSDVVKIKVPIKEYSSLHKSAFLTAVKGLNTNGGTAMYNGVVVALDMLIKEKERNPNVRPVLLLLTDGATTNGLTYEEVEDVVSAINIPIYTIGFEADIQELNRLSSLVESSSTNAERDDISYKIGSLLNTQM